MFVRTHTSTPFGDAFFVVFDRIEVVGKVNVLSTSCPRPGNEPQGIHEERWAVPSLFCRWESWRRLFL
jgi:hypothetical protein